MTRLQKLIEKLRRERGPSRLHDVERLLTSEGWHRTGGRGSHRVYEKEPGMTSISFPVVGGQFVKRTYVVRMLRQLDLNG